MLTQSRDAVERLKRAGFGRYEFRIRSQRDQKDPTSIATFVLFLCSLKKIEKHLEKLAHLFRTVVVYEGDTLRYIDLYTTGEKGLYKLEHGEEILVVESAEEQFS